MKRNFFPFIIFISVLAASCSQPLPRLNSDQGNSEATATLQPVEKILSAFAPIQGTDFMLARISADPNTRISNENPLDWIRSSYSSGYDTYNYVFFDLDTETYHRLLPTNDSVIQQIIGFPVTQYNPAEPDAIPEPFEWWLYVVIKADTDQDGRLDADDKKTLGVSDVGGNGYTEIVVDVDNMLGEIYKENSILFLIYNAGDKNYLAKINLTAREVVTTTEMDLGEDVK
jgi:hypothetical protein